jgi:hypothetical protein
MSKAEIRAKATLDNVDLKAGLRESQEAAESFADKTAASVKASLAGAFSTAAIVGFAKSVIDLADEVDGAANRIGISVESFQALSSSALLNSSSMATMEDALVKLRDAQGETLKGNTALTDAFASLGISAERVVGLNVDELMVEIGQKFNGAENQAQAFTAVVDILGKSAGPDLTATLRELGELGLQGVIDKSREAGHSIDADMIAMMAKAQPAIDSFFLRLKAGAATAFGALIEGAHRWGDALSGMVSGQSWGDAWASAFDKAAAREIAAGEAATSKDEQNRKQAAERVSALKETQAKRDAEAEVRATEKRNAEILRLEEQRAKAVEQLRKMETDALIKAQEAEVKAVQDRISAIDDLLRESEANRRRGGKAFADAARADREAEREANRNERAREQITEQAYRDLEKRMKRGMTEEEAMAQLGDQKRKAIELDRLRAGAVDAQGVLDALKPDPKAEQLQAIREMDAAIARLTSGVPVTGIPAGGIPLRLDAGQTIKAELQADPLLAKLDQINERLSPIQWLGRWLP